MTATPQLGQVRLPPSRDVIRRADVNAARSGDPVDAHLGRRARERKRKIRQVSLLHQAAPNAPLIASVTLLEGLQNISAALKDKPKSAGHRANLWASRRVLAAYLSAHRTMINGSALCAALAVTERD